MKKHVIISLMVTACMMITVSCGSNSDAPQAPASVEDVQSIEQEQEDEASDQSEENTQIQTKSFGIYTVPSGWSESGKLSRGEKYFYLKDGISDASATSNISVEAGTNKYAESEHVDFREAILNQISMQISRAPTITDVQGMGTNTENGYILYIFTIEDENITTKQYYIVGDYKYILIHATDFHRENIQDVDEVALAIANSFEWGE